MSGLSAMPLRKLVLTGGEPLLREDVFDLAGTFKASHTSAKLCVNTNGAGVTPECVPDLVRLFDDIRVSVDGFRPVNDY
jgi:MoaA/NifB/PqqE/SkfB family radical SAM enzyme